MFKLPLSKSLVSGPITWQQKLHLSVGVLVQLLIESRAQPECNGCVSGHRENLCIRSERRPSCLSLDQGEHYASCRRVLQNRWKMVYPKCARQLVFIVAMTRVLETGLFLICAFLSTCEFSTCRALSVPDLFFPVDGQQQHRTQGPDSPAFIHWMSHSFHSLVLTPCLHLCVWTLLLRRQRMTTSCLGLFISDLAVSH